MNLIKTSLTPNELKNIRDDLAFIARISEKAQKLGFRIIIHGGYAVDGILGEITRPHNDIDIQIYGRKPAREGVSEILTAVDPLLLSHIFDKGRKEFYHYYHLRKDSGTLAEIYYLQVATDPLSDEKIIVKENGVHASQQTYDTKHVVLESIGFETQNPVTELVDRIYKREYRGDPKFTKHEQDIQNLRLIVDKKDEERALEEMKRR